MEEIVRALEPGTLVSGRYRVLRCIQSGGMGAVYEVSDTNTQRRLALKTLRPGVVPDSALLGRFQQEASITALIESEHVVKVEDFGLDPGTGLLFFTMELLVGHDLAALLKERGPLPPERVARLLWQVALALSSIHDAGIVHRDLKPENLFLKRRDDHEDFVKILDFGVAKALESDPKTTALVGTPLYMPPEQLRGEHPEPRTDVYALGQVAFTLLTAHPYLERGHPEESASQRAQRFGIALPPAFDVWFEKATAVKIAQRFDTAVELCLGLFEALGLELPVVRRDGAVALRSEARHASLPNQASLLESQTTVAVAGASPPQARGIGWGPPAALALLLLTLGIGLLLAFGRGEPPQPGAGAAATPVRAASVVELPPPARAAEPAATGAAAPAAPTRAAPILPAGVEVVSKAAVPKEPGSKRPVPRPKVPPPPSAPPSPVTEVPVDPLFGEH